MSSCKQRRQTPVVQSRLHSSPHKKACSQNNTVQQRKKVSWAHGMPSISNIESIRFWNWALKIMSWHFYFIGKSELTIRWNRIRKLRFLWWRLPQGIWKRSSVNFDLIIVGIPCTRVYMTPTDFRFGWYDCCQATVRALEMILVEEFSPYKAFRNRPEHLSPGNFIVYFIRIKLCLSLWLHFSKTIALCSRSSFVCSDTASDLHSAMIGTELSFTTF